MTTQQPDPRPDVDVDDADLLEQQAPVDPPSDTDPEEAGGAGPSLAGDADSVDLADRLEQLQDVPSADDDYPYQV